LTQLSNIFFPNFNFLSCETKGASIKEEEEEFLKVLESRAAAAEGKIEVTDINKKKSTVEVKELVTLSSVIENLKKDFPGLVSNLFHGNSLLK
jgi:hypothetical protein